MRKIDGYFGERKFVITAAAASLAGSLALAGCGSSSGNADNSPPNIKPDATLSLNCDTSTKTQTLSFANLQTLNNIFIVDTKTGGSSEEVQLLEYSNTDVTLGLGGATKTSAKMGEKLLLGDIPDYDFTVTYGINGTTPGLTAKCAS